MPWKFKGFFFFTPTNFLVPWFSEESGEVTSESIFKALPPLIEPAPASIFYDAGESEAINAADSQWIKTTGEHRNYYKSLRTPG